MKLLYDPRYSFLLTSSDITFFKIHPYIFDIHQLIQNYHVYLHLYYEISYTLSYTFLSLANNMDISIAP